MISKHHVEDIEQDNDNPECKSKTKKTDTENKYKKARDMTASAITIKETSNWVNWIFENWVYSSKVACLQHLETLLIYVLQVPLHLAYLCTLCSLRVFASYISHYTFCSFKTYNFSHFMSLGFCVSYFGTLLEHLCLACLSHLAYFIYVLHSCAFTCEEISHELHFLNLLKDSFRGVVFKI